MTNVLRSRIASLAIAGMLAAPLAFAAPVDDAVAELARDWADIKYKTPANEQAAKYEALANRAHKVSATYPDRAEPLVQDLRHLGQDRDRHHRRSVLGQRPGGIPVADVRPVHQGNDRRGVERDHTPTGARLTSAASVTGPFFHEPTQPGSSWRGAEAR